MHPASNRIVPANALGDGSRLHGASLMVLWAGTGDTRSEWGVEEIAKEILGCW